MAARGRRVPGNPLGSRIRELDLRSRTGVGGGTSSSGRTPGAGVAGRTIAVTNSEGAATWVFANPLPVPPVVAATPVSARPLLCMIRSVTTESVTLAVTDIEGRPAAGTSVHLIAFS